MDENPNDEKTKELTPEELNEVAGGGTAPAPRPDNWIELNSFQWGIGE
jgi:hypothetical protein